MSIPEKLVSDLIAEDPDMIELVEEFVATLSSRVGEFQEAHEKLDWEQLAALAHRLKGAGGSYGYGPLSELGAEMEAAFRQQQAEQFQQWMQQLERLAEAARKGLEGAA